jgi:hypothetical protein
MAIGVLSTAFLGLTAGTAYGHQVAVYHGSDVAWVDATHDHLDVDDRECDGNYVYAQGYDALGFIQVTDTNGCSSGWGHGDGLNFYLFRICEQNVGCSAWRSVT